MIRYDGFKGFFIMKKDPNGSWEYMKSYTRANAKIDFSLDSPKFFGDNSIVNGTAWKAMRSVVHRYPQSKIVMYVEIDNKKIRVRYYDPQEKKYTVWHKQEEFYPYAPKKEIR